MRFDKKSVEFINSIRSCFISEFDSRIKDVNLLTIRMHSIVQAESAHQLCIKGMRINTTLNLVADRWNPNIDGMSELHLILNEHDCYTIYSSDKLMQVKHRFFRSWEDDTRTIIFNNYDSLVVVECNLKLVEPLLYALDKLSAMY